MFWIGLLIGGAVVGIPLLAVIVWVLCQLSHMFDNF
jgi:hypothetical protein